MYPSAPFLFFITLTVTVRPFPASSNDDRYPNNFIHILMKPLVSPPKTLEFRWILSGRLDGLGGERSDPKRGDMVWTFGRLESLAI
jgi:hypothetical protein